MEGEGREGRPGPKQLESSRQRAVVPRVPDWRYTAIMTRRCTAGPHGGHTVNDWVEQA